MSRALLSPYYARLRAELERFGGTVEKFIGDAVMALFGAPVAHEDDPERAVRAALAIRDWVVDQQVDLQLRIAVNTGEVLVALDARPGQGEGMASGDVVNTTARLQAAAPVNGILVGEATRRATAPVISYRPAPPVTAKGKAEPVHAWEAVEARSRFGVDLATTIRTPLVGRIHESRVLSEALERVQREHSPQLVTLVGVPGIGKSRLLAELFARIDSDPSRVVLWRQGRSLPYGDGVTFWALSEMVKAQAGILETDGQQAAEEKLDAAVAALIADPGDAQWIRGHLRPLAGVSTALEPASRSSRGGVHGLASLLRGAVRTEPTRPGLRGPALGRRQSARLRRAPCRLGGRRADAGRLQHATRAVRATPWMGGEHAQRGQALACPPLRTMRHRSCSAA